jgi:hypothetical protein
MRGVFAVATGEVGKRRDDAALPSGATRAARP